MNSLQVPTALYQSIQQKQPLRQGNTPPTQDASTTPTPPPLSDALAQLKQGFHNTPMPQPTLNASIAQPIQVQIMPPKKTAKVDWTSWAFLGVFMGAVTASMWLPWVKRKLSKSTNISLSENFQLIKETGVKFSDVIGADESKKDLMDILDFIKNPEKYRALGAKMPSGVLLQGPPGTGKTLLAKAVAGEAGVPFLSASGSDFIEMFVGVGAQRVRELFSEARKNSKKLNKPVIIFIDEIDSLIQNRAKLGSNGGDAEHLRTITALLNEMDGMVQSKYPIIVMGATNAPLENLDPAMLRPGRLSRHVQVALPDLNGRQDLFDYYGKKYKLSPEAIEHLNTLAKNSFGFSGADIENILNEAAILTARDNHKNITPAMLEEAVERVIQGHTKDLKLTDKVKKQIAVHEIGHAIVGRYLMRDHEIKKVTLVPRANALGLTWSQPKEGNDNLHIKTKEDYLNDIAMAFGGRIAEEIIYGPQKIGTGASGDLEAIRNIAEAMVLEYGWNGYAPRNFSNSRMPISEQTKRSLAKAVDQIVEEGRLRAEAVLNCQRPLLDKATAALLQEETLTNVAFENLVNQHGKPHEMGKKYRFFSWINHHKNRN
ncbi:MAG: AAA family ATPase [Vampirovibrionales bacterium]